MEFFYQFDPLVDAPFPFIQTVKEFFKCGGNVRFVALIGITLRHLLALKLYINQIEFGYFIALDVSFYYLLHVLLHGFYTRRSDRSSVSIVGTASSAYAFETLLGFVPIIV